MIILTDQTGKTVRLENIPRRIVSLVPSQTELLHDLGLNEEVVGITKFCVHPQHWFETKTRVGGTKTLDIEKIKSLDPNLIIVNKEENVKDQVKELSKYFPVYISDVNCLEDAVQMIKDIGILVGKAEAANSIAEKIVGSFSQLRTTGNKLRVCYLIWRKPYMTAGGDTFISDMMERCGFQNIFKEQKRYPQIEIDQLTSNGCEVILLSSEPFPFRQKHVDEIRNQITNNKLQIKEPEIMLVDGEMFSWYGSRLLLAVGYFRQLQNSIFPA